MKTIASILAVSALLSYASSASLVQMHAEYSDALINVGTLDTFAVTWQKIYATDGNEQGVITDDTYATDSNACRSYTDTDTDLSVRVEMNGAWGANTETGINEYQMRDAIVQSAWATYQQLIAAKQYDIYYNCAGFTWNEASPYESYAVCGPHDGQTACPSDTCGVETVQCMNHTTGTYLPSTLRVSAYLDDVLLADSITFTLTSTATDSTDDGCGIEGTIAANLAGFIPVVGSLFAAGIKFECA